MSTFAPQQQEKVKPALISTHGKSVTNPLQLQTAKEEEPLQMKQNPLQLHAAEEEEPLQMKQNPLQLKDVAPSLPNSGNKTGLPDNLKAGVEGLSGYSMDDVKVHYNSEKPSHLQALAYAHGTDIHISPGQEKHLPHEAWHVAQQKQGRVKPTLQMKEGVAVNDDKALETEADMMGSQAVQYKPAPAITAKRQLQTKNNAKTTQLKSVIQFGGGPKPPEGELDNAEEIATTGGFGIFYGTKKGVPYVMAYTKPGNITIEAAYVQIDLKGKNVTLHTSAKDAYRGGIGTSILPVAIRVVATKHTADDSLITLPMGGGAVIKLMIESLSKILGDPSLHEIGDLLKKERKEKKAEKKEGDPNLFDASLAPEHAQHMRALLLGEHGSKMRFISYGKNVTENAGPKDITSTINEYIENIKVKNAQLFVDIPGNLFKIFAAKI
jgi:hypothetical protein